MPSARSHISGEQSNSDAKGALNIKHLQQLEWYGDENEKEGKKVDLFRPRRNAEAEENYVNRLIDENRNRQRGSPKGPLTFGFNSLARGPTIRDSFEPNSYQTWDSIKSSLGGLANTNRRRTLFSPLINIGLPSQFHSIEEIWLHHSYLIRSDKKQNIKNKKEKQK